MVKNSVVIGCIMCIVGLAIRLRTLSRKVHVLRELMGK